MGYPFSNYATLQNIGEIEKRMRNLLTERRFSVTRWYFDKDPHRFSPRVRTGLRVDTAAYFGKGEGWRVGAQPGHGLPADVARFA